MRRELALLSILTGAALAAACDSEAEKTAPAEEPVDETLAPLSPTDQLVRVSMAVRGTRPSPEDLGAIAADPGVLSALTDDYMRGAGFGEMIRDLYNEALKVRVPAAIFPAGFAARGELTGRGVQAINVSVTEAPLRLVEHVVKNDRPLTEIVTADYVLADGNVATVWGLPYDGTGESWEVTRYEDGRPHAGLLSESWLYTRHSSTFSNKNRGRANAIARGLLCHDFVERQVEVDVTIDLADPVQVTNAIENNPTCVSCHQTLDPLAGFFGSFFPLFVPSFLEAYPFTGYVPELHPLFTVKQPGYFGYEGGDVAHLGQMVAEDPRFVQCQARRFYAYFHQVALSEVPHAREAELGRVLAQNMSAKELVKAIVLDPSFLTSHRLRDDLPGEPPTVLKARPWQLARAIAELTGFRWGSELIFDLGYGNLGHIDLMTDSLFGFEVLAGGIDSINVSQSSHSMTASTSAVLRDLSLRAAEFVVEADAQYPDSAKLFPDLEGSDETSVRAALAELHLGVLGQIVAEDSAEVSEAHTVFQGALAEGGDVKRAWKLVLFAMLQHPRMTFY